MAKKANEKATSNKKVEVKKVSRDISSDEETGPAEESAIDPAIIEDTFTEEFSEYNDVDNF